MFSDGVVNEAPGLLGDCTVYGFVGVLWFGEVSFVGDYPRTTHSRYLGTGGLGFEDRVFGVN